ncbi:MAG TPA: cation transporter [Porticoccaceae bacterium]|nr:cation transporter [Porticoccaceae bacterium]
MVHTLATEYSIAVITGQFLIAAAFIGFFGVKMTYVARDLAQASGLGEAFTGAVFIGAATSLSGIIASVTAASQGHASLAVSNSLGGIAAQTLFLVLADLVYRKANLEFAAASVENMMMSAQLMLLLCLLLVAFTVPDISFLAIHPASLLLIAAYLFTVKMLVDTHQKPMWLPRRSYGTVREQRVSRVVQPGSVGLAPLIFKFLGCSLVVGLSGWLIATSGMAIVEHAGLSAGIIGGIFVACATSLPELVIAITAIRAGALALAVGDIVGGNAFDTLFVAVADLFYRDGSIYQAISGQESVWLGTAMLMNCTLLLGLMYRERKGFANIGMESLIILLIYIGAITYLSIN